MKLNANLKLRACRHTSDTKWENSLSPGVTRRRLECDDDRPPVERVTTVVKFSAQSSFSAHVHHGGEEFLVLDGVFSDQYADYPKGYYVRNPTGTGHAPHSDEGCTILVKLWQMDPHDQQQLAINTNDESLWQKDSMYGLVLPLFEADYESVYLMKWSTGKTFSDLTWKAGVEYFVIDGGFSDADGSYHQGSWLRLPAGSTQSITVQQECLVLRKCGHLLNPVSYD